MGALRLTLEQVGTVVRKAGRLQALEERVSQLQDRTIAECPEARFVSRSPAAQRAFALAREAADSEAVVLLQGESGTGKTLLARAIHGWSRRSAEEGLLPAAFLGHLVYGEADEAGLAGFSCRLRIS